MIRAKREQLGLGIGQNVFDNGDPKKFRWDMSEGFWRASILETKKDHQCAKCAEIIRKGSRCASTITFEGAKPTPEDFKRIEYWHPGGRCPRLPVEEEPKY
ncbi:MAG: hypothetical protein A2831_03280 [Candidatus Yanofskybacteria bacterium RIFCSPHIGHO2_01_FULL_44_17]|uniref:Uncharacterized protein n=1 Tax=Candidatus Yanofskybacteria bacterium RIFCSPHIGHO2_01_FULL_44_17 TaxID=1802668 RepID=A0A1F8EXW0_9BACT|nr:MAG: hypothetical protein A2831_03280 [Candidatus Yanofskybacteria bacterium RIFCSPHIGHO2_01_FULL_44_17]